MKRFGNPCHYHSSSVTCYMNKFNLKQTNKQKQTYKQPRPKSWVKRWYKNNSRLKLYLYGNFITVIWLYMTSIICFQRETYYSTNLSCVLPMISGDGEIGFKILLIWTLWLNIVKNWWPLRLSELTQIIFIIVLTHLGLGVPKL